MNKEILSVQLSILLLFSVLRINFERNRNNKKKLRPLSILVQIQARSGILKLLNFGSGAKIVWIRNTGYYFLLLLYT